MPSQKLPPKRPRAPRKAAPSVAQSKLYRITLQVGDLYYHTAAESALDALLQLQPDKISAKCVFTLEYDGMVSSLSRRVGWARASLRNKYVAYYLARNLVALLK